MPLKRKTPPGKGGVVIGFAGRIDTPHRLARSLAQPAPRIASPGRIIAEHLGETEQPADWSLAA